MTDAAGSGTQRRYSYRDLIELKVVKSLRDAGVSLPAARRAVEYLRQEHGDDLKAANLVLSGERPMLVGTDGELVDLIRRGQGVLNIVPLASMVEELDAFLAPGSNGTSGH